MILFRMRAILCQQKLIQLMQTKTEKESLEGKHLVSCKEWQSLLVEPGDMEQNGSYGSSQTRFW